MTCLSISHLVRPWPNTLVSHHPSSLLQYSAARTTDMNGSSSIQALSWFRQMLVSPAARARVAVTRGLFRDLWHAASQCCKIFLLDSGRRRVTLPAHRSVRLLSNVGSAAELPRFLILIKFSSSFSGLNRSIKRRHDEDCFIRSRSVAARRPDVGVCTRDVLQDGS